MPAALLKRPAAFVPIAMSTAALAIVLTYATAFGTAPQADEGTAAHLWQLLMAGQLPIVVFFAVRCLPAQPRRALPVLAVQAAAGLAAIFPVWWLQW